MIINDHQLGWMKETLLRLSVTKQDDDNVDDIVDTFRKLWRVAKAAGVNPYPQSPRLKEALDAINKKL